MRKMVLEYHFAHFILLFSAALILMSVQSVAPNPLMNVFFWSFPWKHIPSSGTAGWLRYLVLHFIPYCHTLMLVKHNLSSYLFGMTARFGTQTHKQNVMCLWVDVSSSIHTFLRYELDETSSPPFFFNVCLHFSTITTNIAPGAGCDLMLSWVWPRDKLRTLLVVIQIWIL